MWKPHSDQLAFIVLQGAMKPIRERCNCLSYPAVNPVSYSKDWPGKRCPLVK